MAGSYLVDTNVVIALLRGEEGLIQRLTPQNEHFINTVVLGELYFGARNSARPERNLAAVDAAVARIGSLLVCDRETAVIYGDVKGRLKKLGRLIPENDLWIAASAIQYRLSIVTRDPHFEVIEDLDTVRW